MMTMNMIKMMILIMMMMINAGCARQVHPRPPINEDEMILIASEG